VQKRNAGDNNKDEDNDNDTLNSEDRDVHPDLCAL